METINVSYKVTYFSSVVVQIYICCYRQKFTNLSHEKVLRGPTEVTMLQDIFAEQSLISTSML